MKQQYPCIILLSTLAVSGTCCKKILTMGTPPDALATGEVFNNNKTAEAATTSIYYEMARGGNCTQAHQTRCLGLMTDELMSLNMVMDETDLFFYHCNLKPGNGMLSYFWNAPYQHIVQANTVIEKLTHSTRLDPVLKQQLIGEARFLRAYNYFNLVNMFGPVPLVVGIDYQKNARLPRSKLADVYQLITEDLQEARQLMESYTAGSQATPATRVRAFNWAATGLLAKVYLYTYKWEKAVQMADEVIAADVFRLEPDPADVFKPMSKEVIWQIPPASKGYGAGDARCFLPLTDRQPPPYVITSQLAGSIEAGDKRKTSWVGTFHLDGQTYHYPFKYRSRWPSDETNSIIRLAELYLVRAEAKAKLGNIHGQYNALDDLNRIRTRAGLPALREGLSQQAILLAIEQERRVEFFAEWGHRWFDLRRAVNPETLRYRIDEVMEMLKPGWEPHKALLPIPAEQLTLNRALEQNPGY